jgi:DNA-binding MarR family transcriptional regulator
MVSTFAVAYLLEHTAAMMVRQSDQVLEERLGIGMSQLKVLVMLSKEPNLRQRNLADRLGQTEASISRQVKLLQQRNLLAVRVNPQSRREHLTVLTPKGLKLTEAALEVLDQYNGPVLGVLSDKQREQLTEMLQPMHGLICVPDKSYACDYSFGDLG